jgi:hypothetical protein
VIRYLVEHAADLRGKAVFVLGYWAGYRVSDVSWLLLDAVHASLKAGWMTVGHKVETRMAAVLIVSITSVRSTSNVQAMWKKQPTVCHHLLLVLWLCRHEQHFALSAC